MRQAKKVSLGDKKLHQLISRHFNPSKLLWKKHVDSVIIKITKAIGMIAKLNYFVPSTVLVNIYNSLIWLYITYGLIAWGNAFNAYLNKILVLQKRVLRRLNLFHLSKRTCHSFICKNSACHVPMLLLKTMLTREWSCKSLSTETFTWFIETRNNFV